MAVCPQAAGQKAGAGFPPKFVGASSCLYWAAIDLLGFVVGLAGFPGDGISGSTFAPGFSPEVKTEIDRMTSELVESMKDRWSFWANQVLELAIIVLSLLAGVLLVIKPKPAGRKLAIARGLVVLLSLPIAGYEGITAMEEQMDLQVRLQKVQVEDAIAREEAKNPSKTEADKQDRRRRVESVFDGMQPIMKGVGLGVMILTMVGVLIINALLLFFMTRPAVKDYMDNIGLHADHPIPNYDPSMGLHAGPLHPAQPLQSPTCVAHIRSPAREAWDFLECVNDPSPCGPGL